MAHSYGDGQLLKYGRIMGLEHPGYPMGVVTSTVFDTTGSCFVTAVAASGLLRITVAGDDTYMGHAETYGHTSVAGEIVNVVPLSAPAVYRLPINSGTMSQALVGDKCDIVMSGNVQGAAVQVTTKGHLIIVGGDIANNAWVDAICNPAVLGSNA